MSENNLSYLSSLTGKKVRAFKGGPESKEGQLLHVKQDYLALLTDDSEVIYYQTNQLKSVVEDTKASFKSSSAESKEDTSYEVLESDSFKGMLDLMVGKNIQIDRGGPESLKGKLLHVNNDFLSLETENNGTVYYQNYHIKSVSVDNSSSEENSNSNDQAEETETETETVSAQNFSDLLNSFQHNWVTINRGGPESIEGVLAGMTNDFVTVIHHEKVHRITNYHIRNISHGPKHQQKQQENNNQSNEQTNENQATNQNASEEQNNQNIQENEQKEKQESKQKSEKSNKEQKQTVVVNETENENKKNNKKVLYEMLMKQVSINLEDALKKAKNRINN